MAHEALVRQWAHTLIAKMLDGELNHGDYRDQFPDEETHDEVMDAITWWVNEHRTKGRPLPSGAPFRWPSDAPMGGED